MIYTLKDYESLLKDCGFLLESHMMNHDRTEITSLTFDSRKAGEGTLFVCKGAAFKRVYLEEALSRGATCYVAGQDYGLDAPRLIVSDIREAMPHLANKFYEKPWQDLALTMITGTKGKTTTAYFLKAIIDDHVKARGQKPCAITSSIENYDGITRTESRLTTPEAFELLALMRRAVNEDVTHMVMEVSSQGLKYNRVSDLRARMGIFTNISEDHISPKEHADFEDYFMSKMKMFAMCDTALVNRRSAYFDKIMDYARDAGNVKTFGFDDDRADYYATDLTLNSQGARFVLHTPTETLEMEMHIPGAVNVDNALAAAAAADVLGMPAASIVSGISRTRVPGRGEVFQTKDGRITILVDFAHNRISFEKQLEMVKDTYPDHDIRAVYGCVGGKALTRRRDMGTLSGGRCLKTYICQDDSGDEPFDHIAQEIAKYVSLAGGESVIIEDREVALKQAVSDSDKPTVILFLGRGEESTQHIGRKYIPVKSDVIIAREQIEALNQASEQ